MAGNQRFQAALNRAPSQSAPMRALAPLAASAILQLQVLRKGWCR
jgi:hypothetical protein